MKLVLSSCRTVGIPQPTQTAGPVVTARHEWGLGVGEEIHFTNPQTDTTQSNHGTGGGEKAVSSSLNFCITNSLFQEAARVQKRDSKQDSYF